MLMPLGILAAIMTVLTAPGLVAQYVEHRRTRPGKDA
jgi:hypothetical protein